MDILRYFSEVLTKHSAKSGAAFAIFALLLVLIRYLLKRPKGGQASLVENIVMAKDIKPLIRLSELLGIPLCAGILAAVLIMKPEFGTRVGLGVATLVMALVIWRSWRLIQWSEGKVLNVSSVLKTTKLPKVKNSNRALADQRDSSTHEEPAIGTGSKTVQEKDIQKKTTS